MYVLGKYGGVNWNPGVFEKAVRVSQWRTIYDGGMLEAVRRWRKDQGGDSEMVEEEHGGGF